MGNLGMESDVYQSRRPVRLQVCYARCYQAHSQQSLKVQDGVSFFFKMESAGPVPFLLRPQAVSMAGSLFANYGFMVWISRIPSSPGGSDSKEPACNVGDMAWIPGLWRSPGEGNGYPLQYSGLENPWTEEPGLGHNKSPGNTDYIWRMGTQWGSFFEFVSNHHKWSLKSLPSWISWCMEG